MNSAFHMDAPVSLRLAGSAAFRDLGGAPAADGRRLATGRLFRSDALVELTEGDRAIVDGVGLRVVCDLRSVAERERAPCLDWMEPAPRRICLDLSAGLGASTAAAIACMRAGPDPEAAASMMRATYRELPRSSAALLRQLFDMLVAGEFPALLHCTAGKDRTGFVVAMVLEALGVSREFVVADYLRGSGRDPLDHWQPSSRLLETMVGRVLDPDEAVLVHGVRLEYLEAAYATIESDWGDSTRYLERAAGLTTDRCRVMREHFLT